jgi:hypothetical protein
MVLDLDALVASLPAKKEQKQLQELAQRREGILGRFANDSVLVSTKDPRGLNSVGQCMYIIHCVEVGLGKQQIVDLFFGDEFSVDTLVNVIGIKNIVDTKA